MRSWRTKRIAGRRAIGLTSLAVWLAGAALAAPVTENTAAQTSVAAQTTPGPQTAPVLQTSQVPQTTPGPLAAQVLVPGAVRVVGASEGSAAGLLDPETDLGEALWSGSRRGKIVSLLQGALPVTDPALRALARRIILSKADAPDGAAKRALVTTRIAELMRAGMIAEAGELASRSKLPGDKDFARVQADALLYAGRTDVVCGSATNRRLSDARPFWLELRAYCAHVNHNTVLEELTGLVLKARPADPAFDTLFADIRDKKADIPEKIDAPTALHVFLLRQLDLPLPTGLVQINATPENLFVLQDDRQHMDARLRAAEYLALRGALSVTDFHALTQMYRPASSEILDAASQAPNLGFVHGQMLLHIAAARASDMTRRIALMREAMSLGHLARQPFTAARFQADVLRTLKPVQDSDMEMLGKALLMAGEDNIAGGWLMGDDPLQILPLLHQLGPAAGGTLQALMIKLAGFRAPAGTVPPKSGKDQSQAEPEQTAKLPQATPVQWLAVRLTSALHELPYSVYQRYPAAFATPLPGTMPDAATMADIRAAAKAPGRHGEAMLEIMAEVRRIGWAHLAPRASVTFVRMLRDMGLKSHARAFAREALLLYAPPEPAPAAAPVAEQKAQP